MVWKGDASGRLAKSLITLIDQVDAKWPVRDRSNDGTIGDARHQATKSEHNPDANRVVRALDISNDPAHGVVSRAIAQSLLDSRDPRILYVISNGQMARSYAKTGTTPWQWAPYSGVNDHTHHCHISVVDTPALYDDTRPWTLADGKPMPIPATTPATSKRFIGITATEFGGDVDRNTSAYTGKYIDDTVLGVALPYRFKGSRQKVRVLKGGKSVVCEIVDVGPWNTNDPYWEKGARPQAESGIDRTGRKTNLAGIDLTPAAARSIGLSGKGLVDWEFVGGNAGGGLGSVVIGTGTVGTAVGFWQSGYFKTAMAIFIIGTIAGLAWYLIPRPTETKP